MTRAVLLATIAALWDLLRRICFGPSRLARTKAFANNGLEAINLAGQRTFDLILMDVQMPEMDGLEATAGIRALQKESGVYVPIIAMTAYAMTGDREKCLNAGMDGYVNKPINPEEFVATVESMVGSAMRG